jgi:hypothetical protein
MAWHDIFTGNSVPKHGRRMQDRDAQADDRMKSATWLAEQGTAESLRALCRRFDLQLEHQLKDRQEKDAVSDLLAGTGPLGADAVREHARSSAHFQYAVRTLERIEGSAAGTTLLLELLANERVENEFHPEKKRTLLLTLAERKDPRIVDASARFLADFDEGVRHAAIEAIAAQEGEAGRAPLEAALKRRDEESTRVRGRLAEVFGQRRWRVDDDGWIAQHMPPGYLLRDGHPVSAR